MGVLDSFFERTAKINLEAAIDYAFNLSIELLKKYGIEDRETLKTKLLEYAAQQGGNEESLTNFATNDKLLTFMKRMLMDMPKAAPVQQEPAKTFKEKKKETSPIPCDRDDCEGIVGEDGDCRLCGTPAESSEMPENFDWGNAQGEKGLIDQAAHFIANEIEVWMPEPTEQEYYSTWSAGHSALITGILDEAEKKFSKLNLEKGALKDAIREAYWRVIKNDGRIL